MKKIPTLFTRLYENHKVVGIIDEITPGCEKALKEGIATIKYDGSCCAIFDGVLYKRYDCKKGKTPPVGAIPCCEPDPVTGHWPHWVEVSMTNPSDKWFAEAYSNTYANTNMEVGTNPKDLEDGTYEAVGPHFQDNPYDYSMDKLIRHGQDPVDVDRDFESIKKFLEEHELEGLVFWLDDEPVCKIKRSDFGFNWN